MKSWKSLVVILAVLLCTGSAFGASQNYVEGEVLVVMEIPKGIAAADINSFEAAIASSANSLASSIGAEAVQAYSAIAVSSGKNVVLMKGQGKSTSQLLASLEGMPGVLGATPNYIKKQSRLPNDGSYGNLWAMPYIEAPRAWDTSIGSRGVFVAVVDTGINYNHVDLAANMGRDRSGNYGIDTLNGDTDPMDDDGHGTHVAGSIGAVGNNGIALAGVNWEVSLLAVKVLGPQGGTSATVIQGLNYILGQKNAGLNIRVANMSLGGWEPVIVNPEMHPEGIACKAVSDAGIVLVVAAGNEYQNLDNPGGPGSDPGHPFTDYRGQLCYPACFQFANMITVASITSNGTRSDFSNYSPSYVHLAAPGSNILSTYYDGGYYWSDGTSMASPHVAGAAALIAAAHPAEGATQIKSRILNNVTPNPSLLSVAPAAVVTTGGHLNVGAAIGAAAPTPTVTPTVTPTPGGGSSGGGCSVGLGASIPALLILSVPLLMLLKRGGA